jgi:hypothetical protein
MNNSTGTLEGGNFYTVSPKVVKGEQFARRIN